MYLFNDKKLDKIQYAKEGTKIKFLKTNSPDKVDVEIDGVKRVYGMRVDSVEVYSYDKELPVKEGDYVRVEDLDGSQELISVSGDVSELEAILDKEEPTNVELKTAIKLLNK